MENILKKEVILNKAACRLIGVAAFIILTSLGAFIRIPLPFTPVPLTLQTFFVLLSAAFLGSGLGLVSQLGYLFLGVSGVPIFSAAGSGYLYLLGPTGGYLFGFLIAALLVGRLIKQIPQRALYVFGLFSLAGMVILFFGSLWLKIFLALPLSKALSLGCLPFIPGDLLKAALAAAIYMKLESRLRKVF